jgi:hypothetical protein
VGAQRGTYVVDAAAEVKQDGLGELAPIDSVVLSQLLARDRRRADVEQYALVLGARLDHVASVRDKVVERREHLCNASEVSSAKGTGKDANAPSRKSTASDLKRVYVSSKTGQRLGEMARSLKVRLSTRSYMLSKRSTQTIEYAPGRTKWETHRGSYA